jgi:hypothetical protein
VERGEIVENKLLGPLDPYGFIPASPLVVPGFIHGFDLPGDPGFIHGFEFAGGRR